MKISSMNINLSHTSYGRSPAGFERLHVEMLPRELARFIGYDPRALVRKARAKKDTAPHNVAERVIELQNDVQRSIDPKRVVNMVDYLKSAFEKGSFANWGPITVVTSSKPDMSEYNQGRVAMDPDADYFIADGQHRYAALLDFARQYPAYCDEFTQGLEIAVLPEDKLVAWAGQAFHDHNYYAVAVRAGKALAVDTRDPVNALAHELARHPVIVACGGIAEERDTLLQGDARFTTHSVLNRFVKGFLFGRAGLERSYSQEPDAEAVTALGDYLTILGEFLPWNREDRDTYLTRTSVVLTALSVVGHDMLVIKMHRGEVAERIEALARMDWRRTNISTWGDVIGPVKPAHEKLVKKTGALVRVPAMVQPASSRPAIDATIKFLRQTMSLVKPEEVAPATNIPAGDEDFGE